MSKGLAAFTEGRHRIPSEWKTDPPIDTGTTGEHARNIDLHQHSIKGEGSSPNDSTSAREKPHIKEGRRIVEANGEPQTHTSVLAKASNLLRESLDVDYTVFFDIKSRLSNVPRE
jgi:hypothetical protein